MKHCLSVLALTVFFLHSPTALADDAIFAGGCFWCMEADFEKLKGVSKVVSGFTGGTKRNPTYNGNHKGHYEAVKVTYDANIVSYQNLLDYFWVNIDPFDDKGQFCDKGPSYLSAIFVETEEEKNLAQASHEKVVAQFPELTVVTPVLDRAKFYPIRGSESYHQDYYINYATRYKYYRWSCGRDQRLRDIWGEKAIH